MARLMSFKKREARIAAKFALSNAALAQEALETRKAFASPMVANFGSCALAHAFFTMAGSELLTP
jgi:hypothetical protein